MAATVLSLDTKPALDPRRTHLRDENCGPVTADESRALFSFPATACGTTSRLEGNYLLYENEVIFKGQAIPEANPVITRDSRYRLTLSCRYPLNETLRAWAQQLPGGIVTPVPYAFGARAALAAFRQGRSMDEHISFQKAADISAGVAEPVRVWFLVLGMALFAVASLVGTIA